MQTTSRRRAEQRSRAHDDEFGPILPFLQAARRWRRRKHLDPIGGIPRQFVFEELPAFEFTPQKEPSPQTRREAHSLFENRIKIAPSFQKRSTDAKCDVWGSLFHFLKLAAYHGAAVYYPRNHNHPFWSRNLEQVIACAVEAGLAIDYRADAGNPLEHPDAKMSRLLPVASEFEQFVRFDPMEFDPAAFEGDRLVLMFAPSEKGKPRREIPFDETDPTAVETQRWLQAINDVNAACEITVERYCPFREDWGPRIVLRSKLVARFSKRFKYHGRIYTNKYGHQCLPKIERRRIRFNGKPSVELDYGSLHARMLYHLEGVDYRNDPYDLWCDGCQNQQVKDARRFLAKLVLNTAISADSRRDAISSCREKKCRWNRSRKSKDGKPPKPATLKTGTALQRAETIRKALKITGLTLDGIYDLILDRHRLIANEFGRNAGMKLMRLDGRITLRILRHFAKRQIPCLPLHDSYIVPKAFRTELHDVMMREYRNDFGFDPVIK